MNTTITIGFTPAELRVLNLVTVMGEEAKGRDKQVLEKAKLKLRKSYADYMSYRAAGT